MAHFRGQDFSFSTCFSFFSSDPAGIRTQDPRLKRALLYQLSYGIITNAFLKSDRKGTTIRINFQSVTSYFL